MRGIKGSPLGSGGVLLVSQTSKGRELLKELLKGSGYTASAEAASGGEARRLLISSSFEAMIVNAPLPDEFGHELSLYGAEEGIGVILAVKNELFDELDAKVGGFGVLTVGKPLSRPLFHQALSLMSASQRQLRRYEEENRALRRKLEELRLVSRAKCLLVEFRHLTEGEAHRYLEQEAMDARITRKAAAENIVKLYGERL